jgi:hypothetical protein
MLKKYYCKGAVHVTLRVQIGSYSYTFAWRLYEAWEQGQPLRSLADVIRQHRAKHARDMLITACEEAIQTGNIESVLRRFTTTPVLA